MTSELRIRIDVAIPWPANRLDSAMQSKAWDEVMGYLVVGVEELGGHLHASEKLVAARTRGSSVVERNAHNVQVAGSIPAPSTGPLGAPVPPPDDPFFVPPMLRGVGQS